MLLGVAVATHCPNFQLLPSACSERACKVDDFTCGRILKFDPSTVTGHSRLLPHCYQNRTNQTHLGPCRAHPVLWFLVQLS